MNTLKARTGALILIIGAILGLTAFAAHEPTHRAAPKLISSPAPAASSHLPAPSTTTTTQVPATVASTATTAAPQTSLVPRTATAKPVAYVTTTTEAPATDWPDPLQVAQSQVGKTGPYAEGGFWCAKFVSWTAEQTGVKDWQSEDGPSALANNALEDGRAHANPQAGDMVFINLAPQHSAADQVSHVGIVESVNGDEIVTIEGNYSSAQVVERVTRHIGDGYVIGFASFQR